jgi:hypothetical protein
VTYAPIEQDLGTVYALVALFVGIITGTLTAPKRSD